MLLTITNGPTWPNLRPIRNGTLDIRPSFRQADGTSTTIGLYQGVLDVTTNTWLTKDGAAFRVPGGEKGSIEPPRLDCVERLYDRDGMMIEQNFSMYAVIESGAANNYSFDYRTAPKGLKLVDSLPLTLQNAQDATTAATNAAASASASEKLLLAAANILRFTTAAEREAVSPVAGTYSFTTATGEYHRRENGVWVLRGNTTRSIATITAIAGNKLSISYTDGSTPSEFPLPPGPKGDSVKGDPGVRGPAGLNRIAIGTTLVKGAVYYWSGTVDKILRPQDQERALSGIGIVDKYGDLCPVGSVVEVDGLGYVKDTDYYVESADANGRNLAVVPNHFPDSLLPSSARAYIYAGRTMDRGDGKGVIMLFAGTALVAPGAKAAVALWTDFSDIAYLATPTLQQMARDIDSDTGGLGINKIYTETDSGVLAGVTAPSPTSRLVNGVTKTTFLQDVYYNGAHTRRPGGWGIAGDNDYLWTLAIADAAQMGFGLTWGQTATALFRAIFYGNATNVDYLLIQSATITGAGATAAINGTTLQQGNISVVPSKAYMNLRLNVEGKVVKVKLAAYDANKTLANQGQTELALPWSATYTHTANFPLGTPEFTGTNGSVRLVMASQSGDPRIPAEYKRPT